MGSGFDNSQPVRRLRQKERAAEIFSGGLLPQTCFPAPCHNPPIIFLTDWTKGRGKGVGGLGGGKGEGKGKAARELEETAFLADGLDLLDRIACGAGQRRTKLGP